MEFLLSPEGALAMALLTTLLAWLESATLPWAPFLILYAIALPIFPLLAGTYRFGPPAAAFLDRPGEIALFWVLILAWEIGIAGLWLEKRLLPRLGKESLPTWSPALAMEALLDATGKGVRLPAKAVAAWYGFYYLAWAPVCEELFFWGYLYPILREGNGPVTSSLIVAAFFGVRHGLHFLYLPSPFPWPAAAFIMASATGAGFLNGLMYEASGSLWPLVLLHLVSNLVSLAMRPATTAP
jgi:membrane protease YdiL (CAAX protease family)